MEWSGGDPRLSFNKRGRIVVATRAGEAFVADVETKNGWCILPDDREKRAVLEDDGWPNHWLWIRAPGDGL